VIWGSLARTARRVPGRWCSGRGTGVMRYWKIFVPRLRCARCGVSHALLPAFTLAWPLDVAETIGSVVGEVVAGGGCGVRPAAERAGVPYTTARGWVRRFRARAAELGVAFAAVAVELGGQAVTPPAGAAAVSAVSAVSAAAAAAAIAAIAGAAKPARTTTARPAAAAGAAR
jgi:hypothetical protein